MTAGAVGVLAVLGEFFADGEMILEGVFVQGWYIVWRRGRRIVEYDFDHPGAARDWVGTPRSIIHAENGSASDDTAVSGVFGLHANEFVTSNLIAHHVVELPVHL